MTPAERILALSSQVPGLPGIYPTDFTLFVIDHTQDWVSTIAMDCHDGTENTLFINPDWVHKATDQQIIYALAFHMVIRSVGLTKNPEGVNEGRWNVALNFFINDILDRNGVVSGQPDRLIDPEFRDMTVEEIYAALEAHYAE